MCPSFLPLPKSADGGAPSGKHLLLFISHNKGCQYYVGTYDTQANRFVPDNHGRMSWVDNTYFAPEALVDGHGRQIMWSWLTDNPAGEMQKGWSGVYGLPRSLWLGEDGTLRMAPVKELETLRAREQSWHDVALADGAQHLLRRHYGRFLRAGDRHRPGRRQTVWRQSPHVARQRRRNAGCTTTPEQRACALTRLAAASMADAYWSKPRSNCGMASRSRCACLSTDRSWKSTPTTGRRLAGASFRDAATVWAWPCLPGAASDVFQRQGVGNDARQSVLTLARGGNRVAQPSSVPIVAQPSRLCLSKRDACSTVWSPGAAQDLSQFVGFQSNGIALHAAGTSRLVDQGGEIGFGHSVSTKSGNPQIAAQLLDPRGAVDSSSLQVTGQDSGHFVVASQRRRVSLPTLQGGDIHRHDVRQQRRAGGAVRRRKHATQRPGQAVHGSQFCVGQRQSTKEAGQRHIFACGDVTAILADHGAATRAAQQAFTTKRIGQRIVRMRYEGLQHLSQSVESRTGRNIRGQAVGQLRVDDRPDAAASGGCAG